jgi:small subunit ribosomal protein S8
MNHLANLLSNIQSGIIVRHKIVNVKRTKLNLEVLRLLYNEGFIEGFSVSQSKLHNFSVFLKYHDGQPVLKRLKVISLSTRRVYVNYNTIMKHLSRTGIFVISTSKYGLICSDAYFNNDYKLLNIGGELLFQIII